MKIERIASVPLVVHDPYFSIWSGADHLHEEDPRHWSGAKQKMRGYVLINHIPYCFMGDPELYPVIPQTGLDITPVSTEYTFENEWIKMSVRFTSPLLLDDFLLVSRPCTYLEVKVIRKQPADVTITLCLSSDLVKCTEGPVSGGTYHDDDVSYGMMGKIRQHPLGHSGDHITIDWGYLYLAGQDADMEFQCDTEKELLSGSCHLGAEREEAGFILAYDDMIAVNYFGQWRKAYWTKEYGTILNAIKAAFADRESVLKRCQRLDQSILHQANEIGGEDYALLCSLSYRQSIAAHKLIEDEEGNLIFLSKENDSNGCIGTADVSYPSIPLFLLYHTDYVKGMLRPIFRFADCKVWEYEFAPHDVGRYPYAWGQVYGLKEEKNHLEYSNDNGDVLPPFYLYPPCDIYDLNYQMPVEECGNMLIMTAVCCRQDGNTDFALPYMPKLKKWAEYLLKYGADPGEQLCTDDFAGHLAHNANLAVKAVMGIKAYAMILEMNGEKETSEEYLQKAAKMAKTWEQTASAGDHYMLAFGNPDSWSLKYNLIWDEFLGAPLFSKEVRKKELSYYCQKVNRYGVPLDSRRAYTKSDWILWCAAMADNRAERDTLISPVADYLKESKSRVPFSDWYETEDGSCCNFIGRSVQGGIFMPMFMKGTD